MKIRLFLITLLLSAMYINAQEWVQMLQKPGANFYEIQKSFNEYWKGKDFNVKGRGFKQYKRWEYFVEPRVYPSGDLSVISNTWKNYEGFLHQNAGGKFNNNDQIASTTWTAIGPMGAPSGVANSGFPTKAGRDIFITFHPSTPNTFWVGTPAGGLWKTTNNGSSWTTNTDNLPIIGCSDLAIDPSNPNVMYLATGDGDAGDTFCIGVLKSTDGGATWNPTSLTFSVSQQVYMRKLIIDPSNPQTLIAATSSGIYRTTNGAGTWTQINNANSFDVEFNTAGTSTVYAAGTTFSVSTNGGVSFTQIGAGIPTGGSARMNIAVTPTNSNYVYVLSANTTSAGLQGVYRSTNGGNSFSTMATSPNILANSCSSPAGDGQGWYDLAFAVSPVNQNEVIVGGVNVWKSLNGGATWTVIGCWNNANNPPFVHADHHELEYSPNGTLYSCNDGGTYYYTGSSWTDISGNRNIAEIYRIGLSATNPYLFITGHQDNGTNIFNNGTYSGSMGGDGMDCFIDRTNNTLMFAEYYYGQFQKSGNGGASWTSCVNGMSGGAVWVAPWKQDPVSANILYAGRQQMFKTTNSGAFWSQAGTIPGVNPNQGIIEFAIAPSNNQVLAVIHGTTGIYKTTNAGASWASVTGTLPVNSAVASNITFDPTNANTFYVTFSGYSAGNKVFKTTDGGATYTNISYNLPNIPANCIVYEPGTNGRVYVGMDVGVYYTDNLAGTWTLYNSGLPNVPVRDMEISPALSLRLRAATYGRGVWETDVVPGNQPPASNFLYYPGICTSTAKTFSDVSTNNPTSWSWSITPSIGVTVNIPSAQNPTVTFDNPGTYTVSLMAGNGFGPGSLYTQTISVLTSPTVMVSNPSQTLCAGISTTISASGGTTYLWSNGAITSSILVSPATTTVYTVTGHNGLCMDQKTATINVLPSPTVTVNSPSFCATGTVVLNASGATTYSWSTGPTTSSISVSPTTTTVYSVTGTTGSCSTVKTATVTVFSMPTTQVTSATICAGDQASLFAGGATTYTWDNGSNGPNITVSPASSTVFVVTGINGLCSSTAAANVIVNALPSLTITADTLICIGNTVTLNAYGAANYTWMPINLTGSTVVDSPTMATTYYLSAVDVNGCSGTAIFSVNVDPCAGIIQHGKENVIFYLYPNPASDKLTLRINVSSSFDGACEIKDISGKIVMKQNLKFVKEKSEYHFNISPFANGVYFFRMSSKDASSGELKVVKE
jgi:hypothetical protein